MLSVARIFDAPPAAAPRNSPAALTQVTAVALYARHMTLREPGPFEPLTPSERAADIADARMSAPDAMSLDADAGNGGGADTRPAEMTAEEEELALYGAVAATTSSASAASYDGGDDCQGGTSRWQRCRWWSTTTSASRTKRRTFCL
jgi:hypothetical protein